MTRQRCVEHDAALASLSKRPDILSLIDSDHLLQPIAGSERRFLVSDQADGVMIVGKLRRFLQEKGR